jgi:hypothetical protein
LQKTAEKNLKLGKGEEGKNVRGLCDKERKTDHVFAAALQI